MNITSLNLFGRMDNWPDRQTRIIDYLDRAAPDIAFFQEVVYLPDVSPTTQVTELNAILGYPYEHIAVTRLQTSDTYSEYREGQGILSKYPIVKSETLVLRQHPEDHLQRIVQLVDVDYHGVIVQFANIQFAELPRHAGIHFKELIDILRARDESRIILGDFNIPNIDIQVFRQLWEADYISSSATPYISYPLMDTRVDYILLPKAFAFEAITVSSEGLSDHLALSATVTIPMPLLGELDSPSLTDDVDLDSAGVLHSALDLGSNIAR